VIRPLPKTMPHGWVTRETQNSALRVGVGEYTGIFTPPFRELATNIKDKLQYQIVSVLKYYSLKSFFTFNADNSIRVAQKTGKTSERKHYEISRHIRYSWFEFT